MIKKLILEEKDANLKSKLPPSQSNLAKLWFFSQVNIEEEELLFSKAYNQEICLLQALIVSMVSPWKELMLLMWSELQQRSLLMELQLMLMTVFSSGNPDILKIN